MRGALPAVRSRVAAVPPAALSRPAGHRRQAPDAAARLPARARVAALACVALVSFAAPSQADVLVSNLAREIQIGTFTINDDEVAKGFRTGSTVGGYTLTSVDIEVDTVPSTTTNLTVEIWSATTDGTRPPDARVFSLTNPATLSRGLNAFTAPANSVLEPDTYYHVFVRNDSAPIALKGTITRWPQDIDRSGMDGWRLFNGFGRTRGSSDTWTANGALFKPRLRLNGDPATATATGRPTISGTAQAGETLAASTADISDTDGLTGVTYSYQWIRGDGTVETDIDAATSPSYTLGPDDVGKFVRVKVTFMDDDGNSEELKSAGYPAAGTVAAAVSADLLWSATLTVWGRASARGYLRDGGLAGRASEYGELDDGHLRIWCTVGRIRREKPSMGNESAWIFRNRRQPLLCARTNRSPPLP